MRGGSAIVPRPEQFKDVQSSHRKHTDSLHTPQHWRAKNQQLEKDGRQRRAHKWTKIATSSALLQANSLCIPKRRDAGRSLTSDCLQSCFLFALPWQGSLISMSDWTLPWRHAQVLFTVYLVLAGKAAPNVKVGRNFSQWAFLAAFLWSWRCCKYLTTRLHYRV